MAVERVWTGEDGHYIPDISRTVNHGDTVEFDEAPNNPLFVTAAQAKKTTNPKPDEES